MSDVAPFPGGLNYWIEKGESPIPTAIDVLRTVFRRRTITDLDVTAAHVDHFVPHRAPTFDDRGDFPTGAFRVEASSTAYV